MLDMSVRAKILELMLDLKRDLDLTYVYITHDLATAKFFCDRVAIMYLGRIVEIGPTAEIFAAPKHPYTKALLAAIPEPDPERCAAAQPAARRDSRRGRSRRSAARSTLAARPRSTVVAGRAVTCARCWRPLADRRQRGLRARACRGGHAGGARRRRMQPARISPQSGHSVAGRARGARPGARRRPGRADVARRALTSTMTAAPSRCTSRGRGPCAATGRRRRRRLPALRRVTDPGCGHPLAWRR